MIRISRHSRHHAETKTFRTLRQARFYAAGQVTPTPTIQSDDWGTDYAIHDGVVLTVGGCDIRELFPALGGE